MHENKNDIYGWSVHFETLSSGIIFKIDSTKELKNVIRLGQEVGHGGYWLVVEVSPSRYQHRQQRTKIPVYNFEDYLQ